MKTLINVLLAITIFCSSCQKNPVNIRLIPGDLFSTENLPATKFEINGNADTVVTGMSGTKIFIPKNTFVDPYGSPASGRVTIELKEALNPMDMVMGNMTTLTDGRVLQSGGMIYLNAKSENQSLEIAHDKSISLAVPAEVKVDSMMIYAAEYDSTSGQFNWVNPEDRMIRISRVDSDSLPCMAGDALKSVPSKELAENSVPDAPPVKPEHIENSDTTISLIFDTLDFPEFSQYRNVKFKLVESINYDPDDTKSSWQNIQLDKSETEGEYLLTLSRLTENGELSQRYKVSPVLSGSDYKTAMKVYEQKFASYEQKKKEIEERRIEAELKREQELKEIKERWIAEERQRKEELKKRQLASKYSGTNSFYVDESTSYVFMINKLGWSNIDRLYNAPGSRAVDFRTVISEEKVYEQIYISLLFDKEKIYLPGYQKKDGSFGFSHNDKEKMILPVGSSAVIMATAYKDGELHFASRRITVADNIQVNLEPLPIKEEALKELIQKSI